MLSSRKRSLALALVALTLALAGGCKPAATPTTPSTTTTASPTVEPKSGGTLSLSESYETADMDPHYTGTGLPATTLYSLFYSSLIRMEPSLDYVKFIPGLAESWEASPDGRTWTFHLRQGVKWHNIPPVNGRELTSEDVKFSFERAILPDTISFGRFPGLIRVDTPDKYTAKFVFEKPYASLLFQLASPSAVVIAHEVIEQDGDAGSTFIGTGPFILEDVTKGVGAHYSRNPDYFEEGKPYVDRAEISFIPESALRLAAFRAGRLDVLQVGVTDRDSIAATVPDATIIDRVNTSANVLHMNNVRSPFDDARVRKAIMYLVDQDAIIQAILDGAGGRMGFLRPEFHDLWGARRVEDLLQHDVVKAKELLAEAGYPDGFKTSIHLSSARPSALQELIVAQLAEGGIEAEIVALEHANYAKVFYSKEFDLITSSYFGYHPDPDVSLSIHFSRERGSLNAGSYYDPRVEELISLQAATVDPVERKKQVEEALDIIWEAIPVVPLYYSWAYDAYHPWVKGWESGQNSRLSYENVVDVWLDK